MKKKICALCYYARMKRDICGIYCTGGFENPDGTCDRFESYQERRKRQRKKREVEKDRYDPNVKQTKPAAEEV